MTSGNNNFMVEGFSNDSCSR